MRLFLLILVVIMGTVCNAGEADADKNKDIDIVVKQYREYILRYSPGQKEQLKKTVSANIVNMNEEGAWNDIDYESKQRSAWVTSNHLSRVQQMTIAYENGLFFDEEKDLLKDSIHKSLGYWIKNDFICPNWWHNNIGVPQFLTAIALLLGDEFTANEMNYLTQKTLPRTKIAMTGQNRVWLAENTLVGALVAKDAKLAKQAIDVIFSEIVVTENEGIQPDWSFHQHGAQLQIGNYGLSFASEITKWSEILRGTSLQMPVEKMNIFRNYLLNGQNWPVWRGKMDISFCGRQISPGSPVTKGNSVYNSFTAMARTDTEFTKEYTAFLKRNRPDFTNDLTGNKYFWRSDVMIHRRPDFYMSVKMSSARVIGAESLNSENLSGLHLADGAAYIYRTGEEYTDIFPVWNWRQLPGITNIRVDMPIPKFSNSKINSKFVGGLSDGTNGFTVMDFTRDGITAKKAWFFADDQIICLGSSINTSEIVTAPVITTVNQCLLNGKVKVSNGKEEKILDNGELKSDDIVWAEHDGIRYTFPNLQKITLYAGAQTGNWNKIYQTGSTPKADITKNIFNIVIEHDANPKDGSYAYIIQPTEKGRQQKSDILRNTGQLQAVKQGNLIQAVYYEPGELQYAPEKTISVNQPCLVMIDNAEKPEKIYVSDPTQSLISLTISVNGKKYNVKLPAGGEKGKTVAVDLVI